MKSKGKVLKQKIITAENIICPYCGRKPELRDNSIIYGRTYGHGKTWICAGFPECDSYVGAHPSGEPLGIMTDAEHRSLKKEAHALFDPLWKGGEMSRPEAYKYLQKIMELDADHAHIGMMTKDQLKILIDRLKKK